MGALDYKTRRHRRNRLAAELAATYSPRRHFRLGQDVGWHWQFDNPNDLYRRRNLLTYTTQFDNAAWNKFRSTIVANATTAPDGTMTADALYEAAVPNTHVVALTMASQSGAGRLSVYAKANGRSWLSIETNYGGVVRSYFNLATGVLGTAGSGHSPAISDVGNGWYRCSVAIADMSVGTREFGFLTAQADLTPIHVGDTGLGVYIWGAQLELGSTATEYQPVPTTWAQAYLDAVGAERIYAWKDTAGTDPVTAVGEGIGLLLGREYGGATGPSLLANGATGLTGTATAASYSTTTFAGSVSRAGDASNQSWVTWTGLTTSAVHRIRITNTGATSLDVRNGGVAGTIVASIAAGASTWVHPATTGGSTSITITATSNSTTATFTLGQFAVLPGTHLTQATGTAKPTLSARVNLLLSTTTMSTQNVTTVATGYKLSFTGTGTVTLSGTSTAGPLVGTGANDRVSLTFTPTAGTLTLTVSGSVTLADLRTADDAAKNIPAYQRVGATAVDHDTDGFPHYAEGDGTDNCWASVATVDGSGSDKVTTVTALTKNSDAAAGCVLETTTNLATDGAIALWAPPGANTNIVFYSRGTASSSATFTGLAAPITRVMTGSADIAADLCFIEANGAGRVTAATDQGAGNYANATLYVLSRAGASSRFNGRFYGSTGRFGPMSDGDRRNLYDYWRAHCRLP